ncbi:MAG: hypothetical protein ACLTKT_03885 [Clostridia bacterium]|nr:hypothetical protein [Clostridium sp.]MBS6251716.1 hypothetical protein [Clostridium sp.]
MFINQNEINISSMSLEELEKAHKEVRDILSKLDYAIALHKMAKRKHHSDSLRK